ncbi:MAG: hypothetical protein AAFO63_06895 [Pseudomonadota bacterium]
MIDWIVSLALLVLAGIGGFLAHRKIGTVRSDGRAHQVPWHLVLIGCGFVAFLIIVHLLNLIGVQTGPENSLFGRF